MLDLRIYSRYAVQRAYRQLVDAAQMLLAGVIGQLLTAEAEHAILSAVSGSWSVDGHTLTLGRMVLDGPGCELRLGLE